MSAPTNTGQADGLVLHARSRAPDGIAGEQTLRWDPRRTALAICDMWDAHWCRSAASRVGELAPVMDGVVEAARQRGVLVIHAPSDALGDYEGTPQRRRAQDAPLVEAPAELVSWRSLDPECEAPLPIDDADGGCDDEPQCPQGPPWPWQRQHAAIRIAPEDAITDKGQEVYNLLRQRGIEHVLMMGVHTNFCVLGRSFGIRRLVGAGVDVVLVRDMTDTMYNPRMRPFVSHFRGTELMVQHVERWWCPSIGSTDVTGQPAFRFRADAQPA